MTVGRRILFAMTGALFCLCALVRPGVADDAKPTDQPTLSRDQAMAELKKIGGKFVFDEKKPGKPLERIRLQDSRIGDSSLAYLKAFPDLQHLEIVYYNVVTDAGMVHLEGLNELRYLELEGSKVTDAGIAHLAGLTNLEHLNLTNTGITGAGLVHLKGLNKLKRLYLSFTDVTDDGLQHLKGLKQIDFLQLDDTKVTPAAVKELRKALPICKVLSSAADGAGERTSGHRRKTITIPADHASLSGEWPSWRGPNRDGICFDTGLLQEWPAEGPPLKYDARGIGFGHSSIVIENGRIFTTGRLDKSIYLVARNQSDGAKLWQAYLTRDEQDPCATPTAAGEFVYALSSEGEFLCAESATGKEVWRCNFIKDFGGKYMAYKAGGAYSESPLVDGDLVICTPGAPDALLVALNKKTGAVVWKVPIPTNFGPQGVDAAGFSSPVVSTACGIRQYVQMTGRGLISVAAADGKILWTHNSIANSYNNIPTPIISGDYVFASTSHAGDPSSGSALIKLVPENGGINAQEVYRLPERIAGNHHGGMIQVGDYIYLGQGYNRGFPLCLEMMTGKVMWRPGRGPGAGSASIVYADGHLYFHYENGIVALVEATPDAYRLKGKFKMPAEERWAWSHPVVAGGCLYIRGQNTLRCYDVRKPVVEKRDAEAKVPDKGESQPNRQSKVTRRAKSELALVSSDRHSPLSLAANVLAKNLTFLASDSRAELLADATTEAADKPTVEVPLNEAQVKKQIKANRGLVYDDEKNPNEPVTHVWMQDAAFDDASLAVLKWLPKLNRVDIIAYNNVTDAGMFHLEKLPELQTVIVEGSNIGDAGLAHLCRIPRLKRLVLTDTNVTSAGLAQFKGLKAIKIINLSFTQVDDSGLEHLAGLKQLYELRLEDTKVTQAGVDRLKKALPDAHIYTSLDEAGTDAKPPVRTSPASFEPKIDRRLTNDEIVKAIKSLNCEINIDEKNPRRPIIQMRLQGSPVSDETLEYLELLPDLRFLHIAYFNRVTDDGLRHLKGLQKLLYLNFDGSGITDAGMDHVRFLTRLSELELKGTRVGDKGVAKLVSLKRLQKLNLAFTDVSDACIEHLKRFKRLRLLNVADTNITAEGILELQKTLPACRIVGTVENAASIGGNSASSTLAVNSADATLPTIPLPMTKDWPQWRGPNRDGRSGETGLLQEWPPEGPPVRWDIDGVGTGYSTVVVDRGVLYATGRHNKGMFVAARDAATGKRIWEKVTAQIGLEPNSTPTVDENCVYALSVEGVLVCLKRSDGSELWRRDFVKDFGGDYMAHEGGGGFCESVLIDGNRLICTPGAKDCAMAALDKKTGELIWKAPFPVEGVKQGIDAAGFSSVVVSNACGVKQYVQMTGRGLMSVTVDGNLLWWYDGIANRYNNISTPIVVGDYVFATTAHAGDSDAGTALVKISPDRAGGLKANVVYRFAEQVLANHHGGMVLVGNHVYMGHGYNRGFPVCFELTTGKVAWRPGRGPGAGSAAVAYADGCLYFRYEDNTVALIQAAPDSYKLKGKFRVPSDRREWGHPVIADGSLILRCQNRMLSYDIRKH